MKIQKVIKFNLYMSCILLGVLALMLVGATVSYFSSTKQVTNTFTAGNVEIVLSEAAVKKDAVGNLVEDPDARRIFGTADGTPDDYSKYGRVYPGQTVFKDPTVTNTGDNPEWVAVKVTLTDGAGNLNDLIGYPGYEEVDIELLLSGGLLDEKVHFHTWNGIHDVGLNDNYAMIQKASVAEGRYEFYFLMLKPLLSGESVTVFDHVNFASEWTNAEMQQLSDLTIKVEAFGVQTLDLETCFDAMTKAFPTHFDFDRP